MAAAAAASSVPCTVEVLTCASDKSRLLALKKVATNQLAKNAREFEEPLPWDYDFCRYRPHSIHFVAVSDDVVCGWATGNIETYKGIPAFELETITTRRKRMGEQRIGRILHDAIVSYGIAHGLHYIFLRADNDTVVEIYKKWGYKKVFGPDDSFTVPDTITGDDVGKYREHVHHMMMYPLRPSIKPTKNFKKMLQKDAEILTIHEYFSGNHREAFKGGGTRRRRALCLRRRRSRRCSA